MNALHCNHVMNSAQSRGCCFRKCYKHGPHTNSLSLWDSKKMLAAKSKANVNSLKRLLFGSFINGPTQGNLQSEYFGLMQLLRLGGWERQPSFWARNWFKTSSGRHCQNKQPFPQLTLQLATQLCPINFLSATSKPVQRSSSLQSCQCCKTNENSHQIANAA